MQLSFESSFSHTAKTPMVAAFVTDASDVSSTARELDTSQDGALSRLLEREILSADSPGTTTLHGLADGPQHILLVSAGKREDGSAESWRSTGGSIAKAARASEIRDFILLLPAASEHDPDSLPDIASWLTEGIVLADYRFEPYKKSSDDDEKPRYTGIDSLTIVTDDDEVKQQTEHAFAIASATNWARDLANTPGNNMTPEILAQQAVELADSHEHLTVQVMDDNEIQEAGMGLLWGVGKGSVNKPRFIVLEWNPPGASESDEDRLAFVGKAITFDTGGISIKPSAGMTAMRMDKSGGCAVLGAMRAIAQTNVSHRILAVIPSAENMPSSNAYKPGDVLTAKDGTTVEITNTDAEGRLILADAITWAREAGCSRIVELSTLTGAILSALGFYYAGLIAKPDLDWADEILGAADTTGDLAWQLPAVKEYKKVLDSKIADIMNSGERWAGSISAGMFLHHFAKETPFAHIDIAGTGMLNKPQRYYHCAGATGYGVRLLTQLANAHN